MDVLVYAETPEVAQKKVLLCLLAEREAARRGIEISDAEVQAEADQFRRAFGLTDADDTTNWMDSVGLDADSFCGQAFLTHAEQ